MFHQSLQGLAAYPPAEELTAKERAKFCDPDFFRLMKVILIADSASYTFFNARTTAKAREEFLISSERMLQKYNEMSKP